MKRNIKEEEKNTPSLLILCFVFLYTCVNNSQTLFEKFRGSKKNFCSVIICLGAIRLTASSTVLKAGSVSYTAIYTLFLLSSVVSSVQNIDNIILYYSWYLSVCLVFFVIHLTWFCTFTSGKCVIVLCFFWYSLFFFFFLLSCFVYMTFCGSLIHSTSLCSYTYRYIVIVLYIFVVFLSLNLLLSLFVGFFTHRTWSVLMHPVIVLMWFVFIFEKRKMWYAFLCSFLT